MSVILDGNKIRIVNGPDEIVLELNANNDLIIQNNIKDKDIICKVLDNTTVKDVIKIEGKTGRGFIKNFMAITDGQPSALTNYSQPGLLITSIHHGSVWFEDVGEQNGARVMRVLHHDESISVHSYDDTGVTLDKEDILVTNRNGYVGIRTKTFTGVFSIVQPLTDENKPVVYLEQADLSKEMIQFEAIIGEGNPIEEARKKPLKTTHFIKVKLPGGLIRYIPAGTIA